MSLSEKTSVTEKRHRAAPEQQQRARALRREATFPERLIWSRLRNGKLAGLKFRRQHTIGPFIVDFCCLGARLVVELDGLSHVGRAAYDDVRTTELSQRGYRVIRVTNDDVLTNIDAVLEMIAREAGAAL